MSRQNVSPNIFGRGIWNIMTYAAFNYPENPTNVDKAMYIKWLNSIPEILPCITCREHSMLLFEHTLSPDKLSSRSNFKRYVYDLHDAVNRRVGKSSISYEEYLQTVPKLDWLSLHAVCLGYPEVPDNEIKETFSTYFDFLSRKGMFNMSLRQSDFQSRQSLIDAVYEAHNVENKKKGLHVIGRNAFNNYFSYFIV